MHLDPEMAQDGAKLAPNWPQEKAETKEEHLKRAYLKSRRRSAQIGAEEFGGGGSPGTPRARGFNFYQFNQLNLNGISHAIGPKARRISYRSKNNGCKHRLRK